MELTEAIALVGSLSYDRLRDVRDLMEYHLLDDRMQNTLDDGEFKRLRWQRNRVKLNIRGRHSTRDGNGMSWDDLTYPDELADVPAMDNLSRSALFATVNQLVKAKQPQVATRTRADGSPVARGTFQVKTKKDHFIVRDLVTGLPQLDHDGNPIKKDAHYLYFRLYISNQDGTQRSASVYIGSLNRQEPKPFLEAVEAAREAEADGGQIEDWMITRDDLVEAFERGGYDEIKYWRQELDEGH